MNRLDYTHSNIEKLIKLQMTCIRAGDYKMAANLQRRINWFKAPVICIKPVRYMRKQLNNTIPNLQSHCKDSRVTFGNISEYYSKHQLDRFAMSAPVIY